MINPPTVRVTQQLLMRGAADPVEGGWSLEQLQILGVDTGQFLFPSTSCSSCHSSIQIEQLEILDGLLIYEEFIRFNCPRCESTIEVEIGYK